jgi:hypothetical protein
LPALGHNHEHKLAFGLAEVPDVTNAKIRTIIMLFRKGITSVSRVAAG